MVEQWDTDEFHAHNCQATPTYTKTWYRCFPGDPLIKTRILWRTAHATGSSPTISHGAAMKLGGLWAVGCVELRGIHAGIWYPRWQGELACELTAGKLL
jgi:hypothetical protein